MKALIIESNTNIQQNTNIQAAPLQGTKSEDIHTYFGGEKINFTIFVKGPPDSKPSDISSYTVTVRTKEKSGGGSTSSDATLKPLELRVEDLISSTDILRNPKTISLFLNQKSFIVVESVEKLNFALLLQRE